MTLVGMRHRTMMRLRPFLLRDSSLHRLAAPGCARAYNLPDAAILLPCNTLATVQHPRHPLSRATQVSTIIRTSTTEPPSIMSERDDSFFAPPRASSASHDPRAHMQAQSRMRARQMFGLPSDPTSHHPSSEFDDYGSFDQSYAAAASYEIGDEELMEEGGDIMDEDDDDQDERDAEDELDGMAGYEHGHEGEGEEQADNTYLESDASSAAFDPDDDPEAWAERLDELAGTLEMSEAEARALRWGPAIGRERDGEQPPTWTLRLTG